MISDGVRVVMPAANVAITYDSGTCEAYLDIELDDEFIMIT